MEFSLTGDPGPSDLTLDPDFIYGGMGRFWPPAQAGYTMNEFALRVFPYVLCNQPPLNVCLLKGYYVFGRQNATDGSTRPWITRTKTDGTVDTAFGTNGWMYPSHKTNINVVDAAIAGSRMYWLSTVDFFGVHAMRVNCTLLADGDNCGGWGGIIPFGATTTGPIRGANAARIVYDSRYGLFIAGTVTTVARGREIAIARVDTTNGTLVSAFHGNGMNMGLPPWAAQTNSAIDVYDMTVVPAGTPGGERLYVAGRVKGNWGDYDGFLVGLDPHNGYTSAGWSWKSVSYEIDNDDFKYDAVTAITVQRNGRLALAGTSGTDTAGESSMILGRFKADGSYDYSFCGGTSICKRNFPWPGVSDQDRPAAIAEREGNRDLVVALTHARPVPSDQHLRQLVVQFSANGNLKHAQQTMDYPSDSEETPRLSQAFGMWVGRSSQYGYGTGDGVIAVVGMRRWSLVDSDATLTQLIANDSIFADQFGGPHSD